jgi:hypothetical protein
MWTSRFLAVVAAAFVVAGIGCTGGASSLSRDQAADQIRKHPVFQDRDAVRNSVNIQVGEFCEAAGNSSEFQSWLSRHDPMTNLFWEEGAIDIPAPSRIWLTYSSNPPACKAAYEAKIRDEGGLGIGPLHATDGGYWVWSQSVTPKGAGLGLSPSGGTYQVFLKQLQEVSWVSDGRRTTTITAEYRWKWVSTDLGRKLHLQDLEPAVGNATFLRLDDGSWTIRDIVENTQSVALNR